LPGDESPQGLRPSDNWRDNGLGKCDSRCTKTRAGRRQETISPAEEPLPDRTTAGGHPVRAASQFNAEVAEKPRRDRHDRVIAR